jgi:hypothetical protein
MAEAFPLHWPDGWPRTKAPTKSRFDVSFTEARDGLVAEVQRLGGRYIVISTDIETRQDGLPYANQRAPRDTGVAVYFERKGKQMVFACDRWNSVKDNMRAVAKTIEAIRGIERWGASEMLERAFSAFQALPAPVGMRKRPWREVLGCHRDARLSRREVDHFYREAARKAHPDSGGSDEAMSEVNAARAEAHDEVGNA